ncbi:Replication factor C, subunit RFC1 (large subunit) [Phaffia rhodozyma]|uniref:Replication factor C, subunit RFC1 (Large subunit) n=1 Tax=Phaffia rhodozyma TaxID=264483 RepID=A0A0F7SSL8_PHARH|nr:Replication factor C, subunit RFC1 (large subunit) [Phaffia rhodozyma]
MVEPTKSGLVHPLFRAPATAASAQEAPSSSSGQHDPSTVPTVNPSTFDSVSAPPTPIIPVSTPNSAETNSAISTTTKKRKSKLIVDPKQAVISFGKHGGGLGFQPAAVQEPSSDTKQGSNLSSSPGESSKRRTRGKTKPKATREDDDVLELVDFGPTDGRRSAGPARKEKGGRVARKGTLRVDAASNEGGSSAELAIDLDALPTIPVDHVDLSKSPNRPSPRMAHAFFAPRFKSNGASTTSVKNQKDKIADQQPVEARWASSSEEAHCGLVPPMSKNLPSAAGFIWRNRSRSAEDISTQDRWTSKESSRFWQDCISKPNNKELSLDSNPSTQGSIFPFILRHPAFSRFESTLPLDTSFKLSSELWNDKFRPRSASQVLGNEVEATYLRDWLMALEVKIASQRPSSSTNSASTAGSSYDTSRPDSRKKREIVRKVDKSRKKRFKKGDGETDWIVDDDDIGALDHERDMIKSEPNTHNLLDTVPLAADSIDQPLPTEPTDVLLTRSHTYPPSYPRLSADQALSNSILLVGPPGSGKTSSIYACATELDWDVFEVNPGAGKRSGLALVEMVGGVGRNHLVARGGTGSNLAPIASDVPIGSSLSTKKGTSKVKSKPDLSSENALSFMMLDSNRQRAASGIDIPQRPLGSKSSQAVVDLTEDAARPDAKFEFVSSQKKLAEDIVDVQGGSSSGKVRQSMILLEEVDVLYEEDKGFWAAVIALISESRRPVVMTCNDTSTIPLSELPLQTTLVYLSPPSYLSIPYLEQIAKYQRSELSSQYVSRLYTSHGHRTLAPGLVDVVGHPAPSQPQDTTDLRRSINTLQITRSDPTTQSENLLCAEHNPFFSEQSAVFVGSTSTSKNRSASSTDILNISASIMDSKSFMDAHVDWRASTLIDRLEIDRYGTSADDEVGYSLVAKEPADPIEVRLSEVGMEGEMARWIEQHALNQTTGTESQELERLTSAAGDRWPRLEKDRLNHLDQLLTFLESIIFPPAPLLPSKALIIDYVPYIQYMVHIDDLLAKSDEIQETLGYGRGRDGRMMRASARAGMAAVAAALGSGIGGRVPYQRWLWQIEEGDELDAARSSVLDTVTGFSSSSIQE